MSDSIKRYETLKLRHHLSCTLDYSSACTELSFIIRKAYTDLPKTLQSILFQDILSAFKFLPEVQTRQGMSAANLLLQAAEASLPRLKRMLAITEFKHAVIAHKKRYNTKNDEEDSPEQLPQDVLLLIFSLLDMRSLVAASRVCWSWRSAANDNKLWQLQCDVYFESSQSAEKRSSNFSCDKVVDATTIIDWKDTFKRGYIGKFSWKFSSHRGYCKQCKVMVWLDNMKCSNMHPKLKVENPQIRPICHQQVVTYLRHGSFWAYFPSSDSDSDSDSDATSKLWAYSLH
ncbi:hypothetical protein GIB67_007490 [Kingdonia uniflora]|uniref:F-box domain-containing protein n=1 Tax=Kingdonia uniflora TaxID=39325 RepID=A0A7J7LVV6_9MAGN|nr:hypothetical protein GIB67_007490 [Kingdonia uniflora]